MPFAQLASCVPSLRILLCLLQNSESEFKILSASPHSLAFLLIHHARKFSWQILI